MRKGEKIGGAGVAGGYVDIELQGDRADVGELEDLLLDGHGHCTGGGEFLPPMSGMVPGFYAGDDGLRAVALLDGGEGDGVLFNSKRQAMDAAALTAAFGLETVVCSQKRLVKLA